MEMIQEFVGPVKEPMVRKIRRCPASLSGRSPFSTPTKSKNKIVNGMGAINPKTPSRRTHDDRSLSLDYSDLLQVCTCVQYLTWLCFCQQSRDRVGGVETTSRQHTRQ